MWVGESAYLKIAIRYNSMLKSLFIDGTKIEANENRYTFVRRGTWNYHLAGLLDTIDSLYQKLQKNLLQIDK